MPRRTVHAIDGKNTTRKKFEEACKAQGAPHIVIGDEGFGNHAFTDRRGFDRFCRDHPALAGANQADQVARKRVEALREKLGNRKVNAFEARKDKLLGQINDTLAKFLKEADAEGMEEEIALLQAVVSPRLGSVAFYKQPGFSWPFRYYEGLQHTTVCDLAADANSLSSLIVYASSVAGIPEKLTLYERVNLDENGASFTILKQHVPGRWVWDPVWRRYRYVPGRLDLPNLAYYGWANRTRSWAFRDAQGYLT